MLPVRYIISWLYYLLNILYVLCIVHIKNTTYTYKYNIQIPYRYTIRKKLKIEYRKKERNVRTYDFKEL